MPILASSPNTIVPVDRDDRASNATGDAGRDAGVGAAVGGGAGLLTGLGLMAIPGLGPVVAPSDPNAIII